MQKIATNNMIARVAAVVAGLALVAMSFSAFAPVAKAQTTADLQAQISALLAQIAALQAQAGASASSCASFNRDLTIGATGADVTSLQNWLISMGQTIPAGATGYFGGQTQAALAKYQASVGIVPPAGYFGPITRAKVNGSCTGTGTGTGTGSGSTLSGGEADLTDFDLESEDSDGNEGESEVEVATATFDVEDGDVRVERLELIASSTNSSLEDRPWDFFDRVIILVDGDEVADMDVDDRDEWDEEDGQGADVHRLTITGLDIVVREGDEAQITIAFDIASSIDTADLAQEFVFQVPDDGIRAVDGEGIQHYIGASGDLPGNTNETVTFGFVAEESGDLTIGSSSDDPDPTTLIADADEESDDYTVFVFEIENDDDADSLVTDITIDVATSSGVALTSVLDSATLVVDGDEFDGDINANGTIDFDDIDVQIDGDDELEFELMVTLKSNATAGNLTFSIDAADVTAEGADNGDDSTVGGSADGETHTVALTGIVLSGTGKSASTNSDQDLGTFVLEFEVTALEDDAYIYRGADDTAGAASTTGVHYLIYSGGTDLGATTSDSALVQSDADTTTVGSDTYFIVREGQTEEFTLTVTMDPAAGTATALYYVELDAVLFDDSVTPNTTADDTTYTVPDLKEFETGAVSIKATA